MQELESQQTVETLSPTREIVAPGRASEILGVTISRVSTLCHSGRLVHLRIGRIKYPYLDSVLEYKSDEKRLKYAPKRGATMPTYLKRKVTE